MARVKVSGEQIDQITNQISQMWALQLATMAGATFTGFLVVGIVNKLFNKVGYELGISYYIWGGIFGIIAAGVLQSTRPEHTNTIAYAFMGLGVLAIALWVYRTFIAKSHDEKTKENPAE